VTGWEEGPGHIPSASRDDDLLWMAQLEDLSEADLDSLLLGVPPEGAEQLAPLAELAAALRVSALTEPVPPMGVQLRDQVAAGTASDGPGPLALLRRAGSKALLVAAAASAAVALVGVGAARNALPDDLQDAVSAVAGAVGVDVPTSADGGSEVQISDAPADEEVPGTPDSTPGGATPADPGLPGDRAPATPAVPPPAAGNGGNQEPGQPPGSNNAGGNQEPGQPAEGSKAGGNQEPGQPPEGSNAGGNQEPGRPKKTG